MYQNCIYIINWSEQYRWNRSAKISQMVLFHTLGYSLVTLGKQWLTCHPIQNPVGWFNIKMSSYQYRNPHCGDKTILRPTYINNGISYTGKTTSLNRMRAQMMIQYSWEQQVVMVTGRIRLVENWITWRQSPTGFHISCLLWQFIYTT